MLRVYRLWTLSVEVFIARGMSEGGNISGESALRPMSSHSHQLLLQSYIFIADGDAPTGPDRTGGSNVRRPADISPITPPVTRWLHGGPLGANNENVWRGLILAFSLAR